MTQRLSKNQLMKLVVDIMNANGTKSEIDSWINIFKNHVAHSNAQGKRIKIIYFNPS
jgi:nucleoid DNA-binding protein